MVSCYILAPAASWASADDANDFFESQIRPLLIDNCLSCHGAEKQEGNFRLDSREAVLKGGDLGAALVPGDPSRSLMIQAIRRDGDLQMPPETALTPEQQQSLIHWVELGAPWPGDSRPLLPPVAEAARDHWAFQPVTDPQPPQAADSDSASVIDDFVREKLEVAGLHMSREADRRTLIRRVTYSLTGLPPSAAETEAFVGDTDPAAYARVVDRLLDSPAHGEHWARHWLDVARYSDTKGYVYAREERFWVHAWNYRDWVVRAFNSDMPYDRFLLLQIAADQVEDRQEDDLAAMGFLTIGRRFQGVRRDIIDDQIDVVCRGTMSLTVGCARCHDHKYDPVPTADYYSLYGVFDSSREALVELPQQGHTTDETFRKDFAARLATLEKTRQDRRAATQERIRSRTGDYLHAQLELGKYPEEGFDQILAPGDLLPSFVHRWRDYLRDAERNNDPVFVAWHAFRRIPSEDFASQAATVTEQLQTLGDDRFNPRVAAAFRTAPASFPDVINRYATVFQQTESKWQTEIKSARDAGGPEPDHFEDRSDEQLRDVLYSKGRPCDIPDEPIVSTEYDFDSSVCNELWKLQVQLDRTILNAASQPRFAVILRDRAVPVTPRIFRRGNPANKGEDVPRQFLSLLSGGDRQPFAQGSGRLELARAIIDPANPLTARVIVNRVWAHHLGAGLVATLGDFGVRAEPPSHPELLDWLTTRFMADGWSLRKLHRQIVLSAAFRQSSTGPEDSAELLRANTLDPANRLLWRMNAHRLSFEELRDSMLAVSGRLDRQPGGRPTDLFKSPFPVRRTLYGLVDRQFLPGTLRVFDFANPDLHIPQRSETTVPQQALFLMNHPVVLEQAKALADTASSVSDPAEQVRRMFERVFQRDPAPAELNDAIQLISTDQSAAEQPPETAADWSYGFGRYDEDSRSVPEFRVLPHFSGAAWQGGPDFPDAKLGWVQLTATGGHPGNDRQHAAIRRWTSPEEMVLSIRSELVHEPEPGDGIRAFIVSSRRGLLLSATAHHTTVPLNVEKLEVHKGETVDFVVDIGDVLNSDQFLWRCILTSVPAEKNAAVWNSETDFPQHTVRLLTPLEQLAQVLLCSNEFMFVD